MKPNTLCIAVLLLFTLGAAPAGARNLLTPVEGRPEAPDFALKDLKGKTWRLADFRGHPLVVNFWATWCPPCRKEMPSIERGSRWLQRFGGHFITINMGDRPQAIQRFLEQSGVKIRILLDRNGSTAADWGVTGLPVTFVLDPRGRLVYRASGAREWDSPELLVPVRALGADE